MHRTNIDNDDKNIQKHITEVPYGTNKQTQTSWFGGETEAINITIVGTSLTNLKQIPLS